jgi:hypothetical protein
MDAAPCEHCQRLELEITDLRRRLTRAGVELDEPADLIDNDRERELARWLDGHREATAAAGYRAGWARFARYAAPRLREWEHAVVEGSPRRRPAPGTGRPPDTS